MLSSTSSSNADRSDEAAGHSRDIIRAIVALLMVLLALATFVELGTRIGYHRLSRIQRRMHDERAALSRLRTPFGKPTLLLVGNSILLEGVDYPAFEAGMAPEVQTFRFIVEQTGYIDWYYGSRRLFAEGIRPTYLVIGFPAPHLNFSAIRGDYGAHYLFDLPGLIDYSRLAKLDWTSASNLIFAHYSRFYAARSEIRAYILGRLFPSYHNLLHNLTLVPATPDTDEHITAVARERLHALDRLCRNNGVKLIFVITPTGQGGENALAQAGRLSAVTALMPVPTAQLQPSDFADGFHLGPSGRARFTRALIENLRKQLFNHAEASRK